MANQMNLLFQRFMGVSSTQIKTTCITIHKDVLMKNAKTFPTYYQLFKNGN